MSGNIWSSIRSNLTTDTYTPSKLKIKWFLFFTALTAGYKHRPNIKQKNTIDSLAQYLYYPYDELLSIHIL